MTLDEAIQHAREKAREQMYYANFECAEEHEQLAEWLKELKELREIKEEYQKGMDNSYATFMYNKAIDDFADEIVIYGTYNKYGKIIHILEIAEGLKKEGAE